MLRRILRGLIVVAGALMGVWLVAVAYASISSYLNPAPTSGTPMEYIPVYPGAQGVQVQVYESGWRQYGYPYKAVEYITSASPAEVLDFYANALQERATEKWYVEQRSSTQDFLSMARYGTPLDDFQAYQYIFQVTIDRQGQLSHVYVHRSWDHISRW